MIKAIQQKLDSLQVEKYTQELSKVYTELENISDVVNLPWHKDYKLLVTMAFGLLAVGFFFAGRRQYRKIRGLIRILGGSVDLITTQSKILQEEVGILKDINRPFLTRFPQIIDQIKFMCSEATANPNNAELFIMNRTSAFGKIHTYNPKFFTHYDKNNLDNGEETTEILKKLYERHAEGLSHLKSNEDRHKFLFQEDVRELYGHVIESSTKLPEGSFKLIVFDGENSNDLKEKFTKRVFKDVNQVRDIKDPKKGGLIYYLFEKGDLALKWQKKEEIVIEDIESDFTSKKNKIENKIALSVNKIHNELINKVREGKPNTSDEKWLYYDDQIPMQMYLLKIIKGHGTEYHTLIINAMSTDDSGDKERYVDGLFSREKSVFSVFKTLFDETFKKRKEKK